jgi:hypothetical protein
MGYIINTGFLKQPSETKSPADKMDMNTLGLVTEFDDVTPSEYVVYPSNVRQLIVIEPNTMAIVTAYNLENDMEVRFRKILRSNGVPAQGSSTCCGDITVGNSIKLHSVEIPSWKITNAHPIFVLKTPGAYEVDMTDNNDGVVITMRIFPMQDVNDNL